VHRGFWLGIGPGGVGAAENEGFAYPLYLRVGGTVNQRLLVGIEEFAYILDYYSGAGAGTITAVALIYPSRSGGFFAKAGLGLSLASANCPFPEPDDTQSGFGTTLGLGYDMRLGTNVYFTPSVDLLQGTNERPLCPVPGQPRAAVILGYQPAVFVTLGITWH
jgi:hypothetical protein